MKLTVSTQPSTGGAVPTINDNTKIVALDNKQLSQIKGGHNDTIIDDLICPMKK